ncbi:MAG: hypothetical protein OET46_05530 [Xanthomonadales bacterium]|nr:hypothetical protein [Xanthomonadales bacterium]
MLLIFFLGLGVPALWAQDSADTGDDDQSSQKVEQKDDSYRQQMELEDARSRDRTYIDNTYTQSAGQEKIDKLPKESRDNIRDQLVDVIVENGEWEPKDALGEYPYTPTAAAESDPELKKQEQEAWDEQIEKYHEREAAAFGTYRGPVPGPGNPGGQQGGQQGDGAQQGQQGSGAGGQGGQDGAGKSGAGSAGTYQPYKPSSSSSEEEVSTAGVSESALDFLRGGQGRQQSPPQGAEATAQAQQQAQSESESESESKSESKSESVPETQQQLAQEQAAQEQAAEENTEQAENEQQASETPPIDTRGIIAIKDLDKLEGANGSGEEEGQDEP